MIFPYIKVEVLHLIDLKYQIPIIYNMEAAAVQ